MTRLRRGVGLITLLVLMGCGVLLLNFTAPNPTGRRYSSEVPIQFSGNNTADVGLSGERILSRDLGLPRNDEGDQRQCFCTNTSPQYMPPLTECRVCLSYAQITSPYRRPDFVGSSFIAESKNAQNLYYENRDYQQIADYAIAARALGRPLWVFVRVNTYLDPEFYRVVESTGGGVVPYFTVPGYVDPVDQAAAWGLIGAAVVLLLGVWEWSAVKFKPPVSKPPKQAVDPATRAVRGVRDADDFLRRSREKTRRDLDQTMLDD